MLCGLEKSLCLSEPQLSHPGSAHLARMPVDGHLGLACPESLPFSALNPSGQEGGHANPAFTPELGIWP